MSLLKKDRPGFLAADKMITKIAKIYSGISMLCIIVVMFLCVMDIVTSKLFGVTFPAGVEYVQWLLIPIVYTSIAYIQLDGGHISVDLVQKHLPARANNILNGLNYLLGCVVCCYVGYRSAVLTAAYYTKLERSSLASYAFPLWPFALIMTIGFFFLAFAFVWSILRLFFKTPEVHQESWEEMEQAEKSAEISGEKEERA